MKLQINILEGDGVLYNSELELPKEIKLNAPIMAMLNPMQLVLSDECWKIVKLFNKWGT